MFYAYVVITTTQVIVFIDPNKMTPAVHSHFATENLNVTLQPYDKMVAFLEDLVSSLYNLFHVKLGHLPGFVGALTEQQAYLKK